MNLSIFAAVEGTGNDFGTGAIIALVSVVMVFLILALIIGITYGVNLIVNKLPSKKEVATAPSSKVEQASRLDLNDEDATVAALIASIECRNETKKNVKVISVKEIK